MLYVAIDIISFQIFCKWEVWKRRKKRHENLLWYRIFVLFIFYKDRNYGRKSESLTMFLRLTRTQFSFISASWVNDNLVHHVHHCIECSVSLLVSCAKLSPGRKQTFFLFRSHLSVFEKDRFFSPLLYSNEYFY